MSPLLVNILFYLVGPLAAMAMLFYAGVRQANKTNKLERLEAERRAQEAVTSAEKKNQTVETKREEAADKVRVARTVDELTRMWDEGPWGNKH